METASALKKFFLLCIFITASCQVQSQEIINETDNKAVQEVAVVKTWPEKMGDKVAEFEKTFKGQIGIYVEDLNSKMKFTHNAGERYYLASVVKLFVMIEIHRLIYTGKLSWQDTVKVEESKYRDGAGYVNWIPKGKKISIKKLMHHMMMKSDNAATDILIEIASLSAIDDMARRLGVFDLGNLTTLLGVRKEVFRELHPLAGNLSALDYIELWKVRNFEKKLRLFSKLIGKPELIYTTADLNRAFDIFYSKGFNSASLIALSEPLKKMAEGEIISKGVSAQMMGLLKKCTTGGNRIKKGLPVGWEFGHKTGTQFHRICDVGVAFGPSSQKIAILMCAANFDVMATAENAFATLTSDLFSVYEETPPVTHDKKEEDFWPDPF